MKQGNYTNIDNTIFKDPRLSLKAVGLYCKMLSLPGSWKFTKSGLAKITKDGIKAVSSALDELIQYEYIKVIHGRDKNGHFYADYIIINKPP